MSGLIGFCLGLAVLVFVWFPPDLVSWFVASLVPGAIAVKLAQVPPGYSPPRAFGAFVGLWATLFWIPLAMFGAHFLGISG